MLFRSTLHGGELLLPHAVEVALVLRELKLDAECVAAALLAHCAATRDAVLGLRERFGASVAELAEGVARMTMIEALGIRAAAAEAQAAQFEALRKMLLAMAQDVRVVLIKLAEHTQTLRVAVKSADALVRESAARLARDIFAPLANRLGVWQLKWELEDLALRVLEPDTYKRIARLLDEKRGVRETFIEASVARVREALARAGIAAEVSGRPKHIYSILSKMRRKSIEFDALYDVRALRVIVGEIGRAHV